MVKLDMNAPVPGDAPAGAYLADVKNVISKFSAKSSEPMLEVTFACRYSEPFEVMDYIMLGGRGWGMGRSKLTALGVPKDFSGDLDPTSLIGRRVILHLTVNEYTDAQGTKRGNLKPDPALGSHAGYSLEGDEGVTMFDSSGLLASNIVASNPDESVDPGSTPF